MTSEEFVRLTPGTPVRHLLTGQTYLVSTRYGDHVTAIRSAVVDRENWVVDFPGTGDAAIRPEVAILTKLREMRDAMNALPVPLDTLHARKRRRALSSLDDAIDELEDTL